MNDITKLMVRTAYDALDEKLGQDIEIIDIQNISVISDYLILASGNNMNQISAMVDLTDEKMAEAGFRSRRIEGNKNSTWILMDYGDVVIHVFSKEDRAFYDLERIWRDGVTMTRDPFQAEHPCTSSQ